MVNGTCLSGAFGSLPPSSQKPLTYLSSLRIPRQLQTAAPDSEQPETAQADTGEQGAATEQTHADTEQTEAEQPDSDDEQTTAETEQTETDAEQLLPVVIALRDVNLRAGPGVEFERVDGAEEGQVLTIVAQDDTGEWLKLDDGSWIFAALVENVPADLPVESEESAEDEQETQADEDEQDAQTDRAGHPN